MTLRTQPDAAVLSLHALARTRRGALDEDYCTVGPRIHHFKPLPIRIRCADVAFAIKSAAELLQSAICVAMQGGEKPLQRLEEPVRSRQRLVNRIGHIWKSWVGTSTAPH
jgi:hypothetical protein